MLLRLAPDNGSRIIARLDSTHPAFSQSSVVDDADRATAGWHRTEVSATVSGYIPTKRLSKDFSIQPDTIIRATGRPEAPVLTVVEHGDVIEVDTTTEMAQWTRVRFTKAIPVYYQNNALPTTAAIDIRQCNKHRIQPPTAPPPTPSRTNCPPKRGLETGPNGHHLRSATLSEKAQADQHPRPGDRTGATDNSCNEHPTTTSGRRRRTAQSTHATAARQPSHGAHCPTTRRTHP